MSSIITQSQPNTFTIPQPWKIVLLSIVVGSVLSIIWSASFVDSGIGDTVANNLLGYNAKATPIDSMFTASIFAFVAGLAGTFTACNICVFSAIAPLAAGTPSLGRTLRPLLWLSLGLITVAAIYGAIGAQIGPSLPQLSADRLGDPQTGFPVRLIQSVVVFSLIGLIYVIWGLMSLGLLRKPFESENSHSGWQRPALMGATIGAFMIGRPFPLFFKMFQYAAATHNPLFGALAFVLSGLGNILVMAILFLLLSYGTGGRFRRWLTARPGRIQMITAYALLISGIFFITYWGLRLPARFGIGWWPQMPWN